MSDNQYRTPESIDAAARAFYSDGDGEAWGMTSTRALSDDDLRHKRKCNNVERPNYYGTDIHVLLTTCAVLASERDEARRELLERGSELERANDLRIRMRQVSILDDATIFHRTKERDEVRRELARLTARIAFLADVWSGAKVDGNCADAGAVIRKVMMEKP